MVVEVTERFLFFSGRANVKTYKPVHFKSSALSSQPHPQQPPAVPSSATPAQSVKSLPSSAAPDQRTDANSFSAAHLDRSGSQQTVSPQKSVTFTNHNTVFDADASSRGVESAPGNSDVTQSSARWTPNVTSSTSLKMDTSKRKANFRRYIIKCAA